MTNEARVRNRSTPEKGVTKRQLKALKHNTNSSVNIYYILLLFYIVRLSLGATLYALGSGGFNLACEMWTDIKDVAPGHLGDRDSQLDNSHPEVRRPSNAIKNVR